MGVKTSKENQQYKRRINHLKSLMLETDADAEFRHTTSRKKSNVDRASTIKFTRAGTKALTMGIRLPSQDKVDIKRAHQRSPSISDQNDSLNNLQDHMNEEDEFEFAILEQFNLEPLSPRTFLRQNKAKLDTGTKGALDELIKTALDQSVKDRRVYLLSEKPLDEEKPLEEKSYKIENKARVYDENEEKDESFKKNDYPHEDNWDNAMSKQSLYDLGVAATCRKGESSDVPNQDNFFVYIDPYTRIYSVYDGHGPFGNEVSHYVCMSLAKRILEDPVSLIDPEGAIKEAFEKTDALLKKYVSKEKTAKFDCHLSGTSVTLVLQRGYKLYIGQLGDSKVLIGRRFKNKKTLQLEQLNVDHTPDNNEEKQRIYAKGGEIRKWTDGLDRVFVKGRVFPCLATTRSLGDDIGAFIGIESEPEITSFDLNEQSDKFLLIGTNAVFAYLEDAEILNVVNFASADKIKETAEILVKKAVNGWKSSENTFDDMTLIFAYFPWSEPKRT